MSRANRFVIILSVLVIGGLALLVRVRHLGQTSLDFDEYLHVFAAKSLLASGHPALPSGHDYGRALPYTQWVAQSMWWFGTSEAAVRLPSVAAGVALVVLAGAIACAWWGVGAALLVMVLVALDPYCLQMSRVCRMYAPFHLLYLAVGYACYQGLEGSHGWRRLGWWIGAGIGAMLALRLHPLTADLIAGVAGFIALQAVLTRRRQYIWLMAAGITGALAAVALGVAHPAKLWHEVNSAPAYAAQWRYDVLFYLRHWWRIDRWIVVLTLPALAWWIRKHPARGWYMSCLILIPFGLHSFIFDWKEDRYLLQIVPLMLLVIGSALWGWARSVADRLARSTAPMADRLAWGIAAALLAPFLVTFATGRPLSGLDGDVARWREAYTALRPLITPEDQLIISVPLTSAYYLNRLPDYLTLNALVSDSGHETPRGPDGLHRDWYTGRPLVTDAAEMQRVFSEHPSGWIVIDRDRFAYETCVPKAVRELIARRCRRWPSDPSVIVYAWGKG